MAWTSPRTWTNGEIPTQTEMNTHVRDNFNAVAPVGELKYLIRAATSVETVINNGWLECNGAAVSRTTYATLFAVFNALSPALPFGVGDGSTTFNLPDLRGRALWAHAPSGGHANVDTLGDNEGSALSDRGPHHYHAYEVGNVNAFGGMALNGSNVQGTVNTNGGGAQHKPAYLVAGVWAVKF